jgi:hypothetical protein
LSLGGALGSGPTLFLVFLILAAYFAGADCLYTARLAAYLAIVRKHETSDASGVEPTGPIERSAVDAGELILSDVPLPAS